ncbi:MAG: hypothetical protein ABSF28_05880 [Terracidiphilus sp.]
MSVYPSDGDILYGWKSYGRSFALVGAASLVVATVGFAASHGYLFHPHTLSDLMFAFAAQWIGFVLFVLMAMASWGSIQFSLSERGDVEVTELGVRRIIKPGSEEFVPRELIAGFIPRPFGGVTLIELDGNRQMVIPRSIEGYRDCIAQLKAMGITALPATHSVLARKKLPLSGHIANCLIFTASSLAGDMLFSKQSAPLTIWVAGFTLAILLLAAIVLHRRKAYGSLPWLLGGFLSSIFLLWLRK